MIKGCRGVLGITGRDEEMEGVIMGKGWRN